MFRASSAHLQVSDVNCTCMQPLVFSFCKSELLVYCTGNMLTFFHSLGSCVVTANSYFYVVWC